MLIVAPLISDPVEVRNPRVSVPLFHASKNHLIYQPVKWIRIIDNKDLRNADGQTVREILIDTLNKFPTYDLQSQQGSEAAIRDIDDKISSVASIEAMDTLKTANMR